MKQFFDIVVVIPLGPNCQPEFIADTIDSFIHYSVSDHKIIIADDSQKGTGKQVKERFPQVDVIETTEPMGKLCGLYITLSQAFRYALEHYRFTAVLRMDTDALVIGDAPEAAALELFGSDPGVGIAGQYPLDYNGDQWDVSWPRDQVQRLVSSKLLSKPLAHFSLLGVYKKALRNGYKTGESVFGGACFISEPCLQNLQRAGLLPGKIFRNVHLEEDHLFAILVTATGHRLGDLSSNSLPLGCAWKGLPASPEELYSSGKKIIHSTRFWQQMKEAEIRGWFRTKREGNN